MGAAVIPILAISTAVSAYGMYEGAKAQSQSAKYQSQVAASNADIATQQATWAGEEGVQNAAKSQTNTMAKAGGSLAAQGASGVSIDSGSFGDVQQGISQVGLQDAMTIRSNAARQAYGYQTQSVSDKGQSEADKAAAHNDMAAGVIGAGSTLLGGAARASMYADYKNKNATLNTDSYNTDGAAASDAAVLRS